MCFEDPTRYLIFALLFAAVVVCYVSRLRRKPVRTSAALGVVAGIATLVAETASCTSFNLSSAVEHAFFNAALTFVFTTIFIKLNNYRESLRKN